MHVELGIGCNGVLSVLVGAKSGTQEKSGWGVGLRPYGVVRDSHTGIKKKMLKILISLTPKFFE